MGLFLRFLAIPTPGILALAPGTATETPTLQTTGYRALLERGETRRVVRMTGGMSIRTNDGNEGRRCCFRNSLS